MRVGVIGAGLMGTTHVRLLSGEVAGAEVVAISDAVVSSAERLAASVGVRTVYADASELIHDPAVEGVVIASPAVTHEPFVLACLDADKPVLCEKPLAVDAAACRRVLEAEAAHGRRLVQVGFMRRFDPAYVELKARLETIGAPCSRTARTATRSSRRASTREMTLTDSLVHDIDVARWLLGEEFTEVTVLAPRPSPHAPAGVRDPLIVLLRTESGLHVDVECFVNARYGYDIRCEIVGADAAAALPPDPASGFQDRFATAYVRELESWAAGAGAGATAWDGYAASVVCEAAVEVAAHRPSGRDPPAPSRHRLREDTITMKLGAYTACLHDKPLEEALAVLRDLGLDSAEINSGGFLPAVHLPIDDIRASQDARDEYLGLFDAYGITLTALNCNGNPLHPDAEVGDKHGRDVHDAIELAALLGVKRVVTMSGLPAAHAGGTAPSWTVVPWDSVYLDALEYQWERRRRVLEGRPGPCRGRRREGLHRDAPAQRRLQRGDDGAPGDEDQRHPRRRRDGPEPSLLAGHGAAGGDRAARRSDL